MRLAISQTPSNTPSNTPTLTPSNTSCPTFEWFANIKLFECTEGPGLPLSGWTVEHSGVSYTNVQYWIGDTNATWCGISVQDPFVGASYIFELTTLASGWEVCSQNEFGVAWDSFEVVLTNYLGRFCSTPSECILQYEGYIEYKLNGITQFTLGPDTFEFTEYVISETENCSPVYLMYNIAMRFDVDVIGATQTPSATPTLTPTPSPTFCYNPQAWAIFDSNNDRLDLSAWMTSQGSSWKGFNTVPTAPSTVLATFEQQMNAYISYTGWGVTTYSLVNTGMTYNQDPIVILNTANTYAGDFTWVSVLVPSCSVCEDGEYGLIGDTAVPSYTTSDTYRSLNFYYSGTSIPQGYYRLYTTYSSTAMRSSSSSSEYSVGTLVCPVTPTPSPTNTQTATPTATPQLTQTNTPSATPTLTPTTTSSGATLYCYMGIWEVDDPLHPSGGTVNYIDQFGSPQTITGVWLDEYIQFLALEITFITGLITTTCLSPTPSATPTLTPTTTTTNTPSGTPPCVNTIYTHGAVLGTCSDFCNTNYLIQTIDCATQPYGSLTIGDFIYGYSGQAGYIAYSNVSTDTNTGPFRIADIDGTGEILNILVCSGGSCVPL